MPVRRSEFLNLTGGSPPGIGCSSSSRHDESGTGQSGLQSSGQGWLKEDVERGVCLGQQSVLAVPGARSCLGIGQTWSMKSAPGSPDHQDHQVDRPELKVPAHCGPKAGKAGKAPCSQVARGTFPQTPLNTSCARDFKPFQTVGAEAGPEVSTGRGVAKVWTGAPKELLELE